MDLLITGGEVFVDGRLRRLDLGIENDRIAWLGLERPQAARTLDATGCFVLPGMIDTHVHFREPGRTDKEDFASGSAAAVAGGVTTVLEIQNNEPLMIDAATLRAKHEAIAGRTRTNYGLYANLGVQNLADLDALKEEAAAFKVFMTQSVGPLTVTGLGDLWRAFVAVARTGKVLAVHAESDPICKLAREGLADDIGSHALARPPLAEAIAVAEAFELCAATGARINLAHLSTARAAELCADARRRGLPFSAATCPQYLWFTADDAARGGNVFKVNPSIKHAEDRAALQAALRTGAIDHVHSDHAPHTLEEKSRNFNAAPSGIAGIQHQLLVLLELVKRGALSLADVVRISAEAPAQAFDLPGRGRVERGLAADLVVIDPGMRTEVTAASLRSRARSSPWVGTAFSHRIAATVVSGRIAYRDGGGEDPIPSGRRIA